MNVFKYLKLERFHKTVFRFGLTFPRFQRYVRRNMKPISLRYIRLCAMFMFCTILLMNVFEYRKVARFRKTVFSGSRPRNVIRRSGGRSQVQRNIGRRHAERKLWCYDINES